MLVMYPKWPKGFARLRTPRISLLKNPLDGLHARHVLDAIALADARERERRMASIEATGLTNTWNEAFFVNRADFTALASSAAEGSLLGGNLQPVIPALHFHGPASIGRGISILARGVLGTTGTPTITFQVRLGETAGSAYLSGGSVGVSAAITTASGVTNKWWELRLDLICTVQGIGTGNATLAGSGYVMSPAGFAAPYIYPLEPTTPDTATWTQTFNAAVTQYVNLSATWSASSASNTITCKQLIACAFG